MKQTTRRNFLATAGVAALAASLAQGAEEAIKSKAIKIIGVSCSPRMGMTTAKAVQAALDAAKGVDPRIEPEKQMLVANPTNCVVLCDKCDSFCPEEAIAFPNKPEFKKLLQELMRQKRETASDGNKGTPPE